MGYQYNPNSQQFDVPNPHAVENGLLVLVAAVCVASALFALADVRAHIDAADAWRDARCVAVAVALLGAAGAYGRSALTQLRFFFGRGQPADLVPSDQFHTAADLHAALDGSSITYTVPKGTLNGLLYALVRDLVFSAPLTQSRVQEQFRNLLTIVALLISFAASLAGIANAAAVDWIALVYFFIASAAVTRPLARGLRVVDPRYAGAWLIGMIVLAAIVPPVLASVISPHAVVLRHAVDVVPATLVELVGAAILSALLMCAGIATTVRPSRIEIAPHEVKVDITVAPAQLYTELERFLRANWIQGVPNRVYLRELPQTSERGGEFNANVIEETQPVATDAARMTLGHAWTSPTTRMLVIADAVAALFALAGAPLLAYAAPRGAYTPLAIGAALAAVGAFGLRSANPFWRRFTFASKIYWIEWKGQYTRATTHVGALLDRVRSERDIVAVESMTLRVRVAELESIAFSGGDGTPLDPEQRRDLVAILGRFDEATALARQLAGFLRDQGSVVAPLSPVDAERIVAMAAYNAPAPTTPAGTPLLGFAAGPTPVSEQPSPAPSSGAPSPAPASPPYAAPPLGERPTEIIAAVAAASAARICTLCGSTLGADDRFCRECGTAAGPR